MGLFFYTKIGSIISIGDLPTTNIIEPQIDYLLFFCDYCSYYEQLPRNWMFSTLDSVSNLYTGNSINATEKKKYFSGVDGINYIATKDVNFDNTINYDNGIRIPDNYLSKFKISYFNSVLLCLEGGSAGRKIGLLKQDVCFGNKLCNLSFYYGENKFLYYFLQSPQFLSDFQKINLE